MFIVWALEWWYGAGYKAELLRVRERFASSYDYFSIGLLAQTLFAPFRQISAGKVSGSFAVIWQAFVDRLISRIIGALVRTIFIIVGIIWLILLAFVNIPTLIGWAVLPALPFIGFVAAVAGWVPTWQ